MKTYIVLYDTPDRKLGSDPFAFKCQADDTDHAEEQCANAYPTARVLWVCEGSDVQAALDDYYI